MPSAYDQQGAQDMYLNTNATRKEIAEKLGLDPTTLYLWIKNGKWDEMKAAARQAPGIIQQQLYNHITAINDSIAEREDHLPTFQEVEMLRKLIVSTKHMQQLSVSTYIQAFQELTSFIGPQTRDMEFTKRVASVADDYIKGLMRNKHFHIEEKVRDTTDAIKETDSEASVCHPNPQVCHPEVTRPARPHSLGGELTHEPHNTSISFLTAEASAKDVGELARTTLQSGEGRGEAANQACPNDKVGRAQSGNAENKVEHVNPSPSTTSPETPSIPFPDSVSLPDREMTKDQLEQNARQVEQTITREDYIKCEYLLEDKTEDPTETVDFNGVKANLMTVQYNLKQFEEPEWRRNFLSREEVIKNFNLRKR